jgi:ankyrin repeat protein
LLVVFVGVFLKHASLPLAVYFGSTSAVSILLGHGADASAAAESWCSFGSSPEIAELLIKHVNISSSEGITPLIYYASLGQADMVSVLLRNGADLNASSGAAVLNIAVKAESVVVIELLVQHGVDVTFICPDGVSALHLAACNDRVDIAIFLITHGSNVSAFFTVGTHGTSLMVAADRSRLEMVRLLIENGADLNTKEKGGLTALMLAIKAGAGWLAREEFFWKL